MGRGISSPEHHQCTERNSALGWKMPTMKMIRSIGRERLLFLLLFLLN
jgi:hypothetical protein